MCLSLGCNINTAYVYTQAFICLLSNHICYEKLGKTHPSEWVIEFHLGRQAHEVLRRNNHVAQVHYLFCDWAQNG